MQPFGAARLQFADQRAGGSGNDGAGADRDQSAGDVEHVVLAPDARSSIGHHLQDGAAPQHARARGCDVAVPLGNDAFIATLPGPRRVVTLYWTQQRAAGAAKHGNHRK